MIVKIGNQYIFFKHSNYENALNFIFLFFSGVSLNYICPTRRISCGFTVPNEHNINGAEYPRIGEDRRVHFRVLLPTQKSRNQLRGEMTKETDGYWSLVSEKA